MYCFWHWRKIGWIADDSFTADKIVWNRWQAIILLSEISVDETLDDVVLTPLMQTSLGPVLHLSMRGLKRAGHACCPAVRMRSCVKLPRSSITANDVFGCVDICRIVRIPSRLHAGDAQIIVHTSVCQNYSMTLRIRFSTMYESKLAINGR